MKRTISALIAASAGIALAVAGVGTASATTVYDSSSSWDGSASISSFGRPDTATYGQTFTAPSEDVLRSFTFTISTFTSGDIPMRAEVSAWDGAKATGAALWTSDLVTVPGDSAFTTYTFSPGALQLVAGHDYVIYATTSLDAGPANTASQWAVTDDSTIPSGQFVFMNNWTYGELRTSGWDKFGEDLATTLTFDGSASVDSVSPSSVTTRGGEALIITGSGFTDASSLVIGGVSVPFTVVSDTEITATAPAHDEGAVDVAVTNTYGSVPAVGAITYAATPYTVSFDANGHGTAPAAVTVKDGSAATRPADPTASGVTFGGWFANAATTARFDFSTPITHDITLYAKWTPVTVQAPKPEAPTVLPAKTLKVTASDSLEAMGKKTRVTARGLRAGEKYVIRVGGRQVAAGTARADGTVSRAVVIPTSIGAGVRRIAVQGSVTDRKGVTRIRVVASTKKLTMTYKPSGTVQANRTLKLVVHGLAPKEPVTLVYNGKRVSPASAVANGSGTYSITLKKAGWHWGSRTAKAHGLTAHRSGSERVIVGPRIG